MQDKANEEKDTPQTPRPAEDHEDDLGSEAAGVVRGISRSSGRVAARPMIGRLPRQAIKQRLPVRQVARVSDRLATGYDGLSSAAESASQSSSSSSSSSYKQRWKQVRTFAGNLVKNTLLGLAVFESYGFVVDRLAPAPIPKAGTTAPIPGNSASSRCVNLATAAISTTTDNNKTAQTTILPTDHATKDNIIVTQDENEDPEITMLNSEPDEYARANIATHWFAGAVAGSIHGVATSLLEGSTIGFGANFNSRIRMQKAAYHTLHHSFAHSVLFASYEFFKRSILNELHQSDAYESSDCIEGGESESKPTYLGGTYLAGFALAGGLAGQMQHLASHCTESLTFESGIASTKISSRLVIPRPPAIRPLLAAFPPSAIGFIAFEYGKTLTQ